MIGRDTSAITKSRRRFELAQVTREKRCAVVSALLGMELHAVDGARRHRRREAEPDSPSWQPPPGVRAARRTNARGRHGRSREPTPRQPTSARGRGRVPIRCGARAAREDARRRPRRGPAPRHRDPPRSRRRGAACRDRCRSAGVRSAPRSEAVPTGRPRAVAPAADRYRPTPGRISALAPASSSGPETRRIRAPSLRERAFDVAEIAGAVVDDANHRQALQQALRARHKGPIPCVASNGQLQGLADGLEDGFGGMVIIGSVRQHDVQVGAQAPHQTPEELGDQRRRPVRRLAAA